MAKQTFTTGQVLTAAQVNSLQASDFNQTVSVKTASYTLVAADKGTRIEFNTSGSVTCTVNTGLFDAGDTVIIQNRGSGTVTVTAGTATVNTNASLAVAQYGYGTLYFISASASIFFADAGGIPASAFTAKGDILVGTGSGTYDKLGVGANGTNIVADSSTSTGVKWATPASGGGITQLATGSLTGSAVNITSISQDYRDLRIDVLDFYPSSLGRLTFKVNNNSGTIYLGESNLYYTGSNYSQTEIQSGYTHNSDGNNFHTFYIYDYTNAMNKQGYQWFNLKDGGNSANRLFALWQIAINITAINEINLGLTAGTFSGGTYYIYGVK